MLTTKNAPDPPRLSVLALAPVALRAPSAKARTETAPPRAEAMPTPYYPC
jgi:hypothetical protein